MRASITLLLAALALGACSDAAERKAEEVRPVRVIRVGEEASVRSVSYAAEVRPRHEVRLS